MDEDGNVAESYTYTAYGEVTVFDSNGNELDESALGNRYTFQGREIDWSTGLYNFRARWYDAETGRWLVSLLIPVCGNPIGINGGLNQYVFCGNNPVMFVDPEGNVKYRYGTSASDQKFLSDMLKYIRNDKGFDEMFKNFNETFGYDIKKNWTKKLKFGRSRKSGQLGHYNGAGIGGTINIVIGYYGNHRFFVNYCG